MLVKMLSITLNLFHEHIGKIIDFLEINNFATDLSLDGGLSGVAALSDLLTLL